MTTVQDCPSSGTAAARAAFLEALVHDDPVQLYDSAPCGFLTTTPDGVIVKANATFRTWVRRTADELTGELRFVDLLTTGGRIYHETHFAPILRLHDHVREVALDLVRADGQRLPVLVNASLARDEDGKPRAIRIAVFDATERREYEQELLRAKERAEASARRARDLARTLQQTLIPPTPPTIPYLELAAGYRPATEALEVGGDFYDVFPVGQHDWVVTIGDVCGKGLDAAIVAALTRHTIRALAVSHDEPHRILADLDEVLRQHDADRFCTAVIVRLHRSSDGWDALISSGGHPPPLLVPLAGPPSLCEVSGPLVGVFEDSVFEDRLVRLGAGDGLVLYTDGVTESRLGKELFGEARLLASVAVHSPSPKAIVDGVISGVLDFQDGRPRDDVAVLALRVPPSA
jgi:sigma-B regulation protein RsbU (phosphoserine phosphatase)